MDWEEIVRRLREHVTYMRGINMPDTDTWNDQQTTLDQMDNLLRQLPDAVEDATNEAADDAA
jgi:hypothetical protein